MLRSYQLREEGYPSTACWPCPPQDTADQAKRVKHGEDQDMKGNSLGLPDILWLNVLTFLSPEDLLRSLPTCQYWKHLATCDLLWKLLCHRTWPSMMADLSPTLDTSPHGYRDFYLRHIRALLEARRHRISLMGAPAIEHFYGMVLLVDVRDPHTNQGIHSTAISLHDPTTLRQLFKAEVLETKAYQKDPRDLFHFEGKPLDWAPQCMSQSLAFTFTLWDKRANSQAVLCSGLAETDAVFNNYGPSYRPLGDDGTYEEEKFFGEGGCFLSSIPIFAWFVLGHGEDGRVVMQSLAVEVGYRDSARGATRLHGEGRGEDEEDDEVFDCLLQVVTNHLQWV